MVRRALSACLVVALPLTLAAQNRAPARVVAVADVHGAYLQLVVLLQRAGLIDAGRQWIGGSALLVQTGDVMDRGARTRECLDLLMALERQAPKKGGTLVPLLGNHEVMNLMGELQYVTPEIYRTFATKGSEKRREQAYRDYVKFLAAHAGHGHTAVPPGDDAARAAWMGEHPPGFFEYRDALGPTGKYGRWIRAHHAVVQIGDGVFLHGGLSPAMDFPSIRDVDKRVTTELTAFDLIWQALVDGKKIWRYMTLSEAVKFVGEEARWLQEGGSAVSPRVSAAIQQLLGFQGWMVAASPDGPLWYRGLAEAPEDTLIDGVKAMLARLQVRYMVVGHTPQSTAEITLRFENRVYLLDTGMLTQVFHGRASALEIRDGRFTAFYGDQEPDQEPVALPAPPSDKSARQIAPQPGRLYLTPQLERR